MEPLYANIWASHQKYSENWDLQIEGIHCKRKVMFLNSPYWNTEALFGAFETLIQTWNLFSFRNVILYEKLAWRVRLREKAKDKVLVHNLTSSEWPFLRTLFSSFWKSLNLLAPSASANKISLPRLFITPIRVAPPLPRFASRVRTRTFSVVYFLEYSKPTLIKIDSKIEKKKL